MHSLENKFILDATAGFRMMWFNKQHPNTIYLDDRPECEPDIVGDFRNLEQFEDESFRLVVFDPPQHIQEWHQNEYNVSSTFYQNVGLLKKETWASDLQQAFKACWRTLKPYGILIMKWSDHDIRHKRVLSLFPIKPLFGQISKKRKTTKTYWFCFMKIPKGEQKR